MVLAMNRRQKEVAAFVTTVSQLQFENTFNPYAQICDVWDVSNGAELRRENLSRVLNAALTQGVKSVWIARDLGYRGGRRTGLALTDEFHLDLHARLLKTAPLARATKGPAVAERTANIVWRMLQSINEPVFLWNVFPLHPHSPSDPMSNRSHSRAERIACRPVLTWILEKLQPQRVIAIGRDAQLALKELDIESIAIRHPSYGGQGEFIEGLETTYGLARTQSSRNLEPTFI